MAYTRLYRNGGLEAEDFPIEEVSEYIKDPTATVWFDLCTPSPEQLRTISEELGLHPLAVEDALHSHQRAKLDRYPTHLFITAYCAGLARDSGELTSYEMNAFVTSNALVTVRKDVAFDIGQVVARWDDNRDLARSGVSFLLHGLLDYVVDTHFEAVQALDSEIEDLEDRLFEDRPQDQRIQLLTFELRKSLVNLRRVVLPMREVINSVMRRDLQIVDETMTPYFQDIYDHVLRATEWTESLRDLITNVLETHLTLRGNRVNTIMKQVTSWAAIIAVPTAVTGFYGENVPYPGYGHVSGVISSIAIIVVLAAALFLIFKRRGWL
ncbi:magnesium transporter CorA family protein [Rugosimonospora africana]|uniref:Magnesium transporter CorA n=1 Tax=Rugosimonospora africana TaxID=556532 RepID=A0A8J3VSR2_9ACTN|nr:magnesium transporter CorA family protein [Rugosimonospora africana]GIH17622.1 magnesium transporter CorA [Rugosimonospora africana]